MEIKDIISIILTLVSTITSISVVILTYKNLKELKTARLEETRANIVLYIDKQRAQAFHSIIIKNFGKTSGKIQDISISPGLDYSKSGINIGIKPITDYKNIYLAPNQFIKSAFDFRNYPDKVFTVTMKYSSCGKIFSESYDIDISYISSIITTNPSISDNLNALKYINESIRELSDKLG